MDPGLSAEHLRELVDNHAILPEIAVHVATSTAEGVIFNWWDGNGTLVPQITRWIPAPADGRVERGPLAGRRFAVPATVGQLLGQQEA